MNSKTNVESSQPERENLEFDSSAPAGDQPTSPPETPTAVQQDPGESASPIPDDLRKLISREIERRFQSAKDRRWAQLEKQYGVLRELSEEQDSPLPHEGEDGPQPDPEARVLEQAEALLTRLGLGSSPQTESLLHQRSALEGPGGYLDVIDKVLEIILKRAAGDTPSPAGVIAPSGGKLSETDLGQRYQQRKAAIRPGDVHSLTKLKQEFREKGLNIF